MDVTQRDVQAESKPSKMAGANGNGHDDGGGGPARTIPPAAPGPVRPPSPEEIVDSLRFMFAVGIECSNPVIAGGQRVDQLASTGHYDNWRKDLRLGRNLGLRYLRYGPPIHRLYMGRGH